MRVVDFRGGRSRTRTCDLSHVRLSYNAKSSQTCLENPKQTKSRAVWLLPNFAKSRQIYTDKRRYSSKFSGASRHRVSITEKSRVGLNFKPENSAVRSREMRVFRCNWPP